MYNINNKFSCSLLEVLLHDKKLLNDTLNLHKNQYRSLYADFENFKRHKRKEIANTIKNANKELIYHFLNIIDNLESALQSLNNEKVSISKEEDTVIINNIVEGFSLILKNIQHTLSNYGLKTIDTKGKLFNPSIHEAIKNVSSSERDNEIIVEEYQKGYTLNGNLLRASKVVVNINK